MNGPRGGGSRTRSNNGKILVCTVVMFSLMVFGLNFLALQHPDNAPSSNIVAQTQPEFKSSSSNQPSLLPVTNQCGRDYATSLPFSSSIGDCSVPLYEALARGKRSSTTSSYPAVFELDSSCQLKWFLPHEACELLGSIGKIHFQGDSLIRQLMVGVGVVLSGNFRSGGISRFAPVDYLHACQCERQWLCWGAPAGHRFEAGEPQYTLCPNWNRDHVLTTPLEDYNASTGGPVTVISNGIAMHSFSSFQAVQQKMEYQLKQVRQTGGTLIPMTIHHPGANKPISYQKSQGPEAVTSMNEKMTRWAQENQLWPLQLYEYTTGLWSRDGVHYDDENIVFAQLLFNQLWYMRQMRMLKGVPESNPADPTSYKFGQPSDVKVKTYYGSVPRPFVSLPTSQQ